MTREEAQRNLIYSKRWGVKPDDRALDKAIKALEQTRWIPVSERPPETDVDVLVTDDAGGLATVHIDSYGEREKSKEGFWYISQNVTAWKYFPQPYKAESEG